MIAIKGKSRAIVDSNLAMRRWEWDLMRKRQADLRALRRRVDEIRPLWGLLDEMEDLLGVIAEEGYQRSLGRRPGGD